MYDILVTPIDYHNESTVILIEKYKFKEVIVLVTENCKKDLKEGLENICNERGTIIKFEKVEGDITKFLNERFKDKNILINLTGGERVQSLKLLEYSIESEIDSIYIDILRKEKYTWGRKCNEVIEEDIDLDLIDLIEAGGNDVLGETSNLIKNNNIMYLTECIYKNIDFWNKYKQKLYDTNIFKHLNGEVSKVIINLETLDGEEKDLITKILYKLKEKNIITYNTNKDIEVTFLDKTIKNFLFKSGTWLEILTESIISKIKDVDEVKSGVVFIWNRKKSRIKNELDVVAVKDSNIICISCKDSDKYDEATLNELNVYSERLGGRRVKKILVATKKPLKTTILDRAFEMGIEVVILEKDINSFKRALSGIIEK